MTSEAAGSKSLAETWARASSAWVICVLPLATLARLGSPEGGEGQQLAVFIIGGVLASVLLLRGADARVAKWVPVVGGVVTGVLVSLLLALTETTIVDAPLPPLANAARSLLDWALLAMSVAAFGVWIFAGIRRLLRRGHDPQFLLAAAMLVALVAWPMPTESLSENQMGAIAGVAWSWGIGAAMLVAPAALASKGRRAVARVGG